MKDEVRLFFGKEPEVIPIFEVFLQKVSNAHPDVSVRIQKSQISFCAPGPFCWVWLPIRSGIKGRPEHYLIVSFGLNREIVHPRLIDTAQPAPGRWTHHVILGDASKIDEELMAWIGEALRWKNSKASKN